MHSGFKSQCVPTYHLLSVEQIKSIHHATLELLESVGVRVMLPEAVHMLQDAGCRVKEDNLVKIPNWGQMATEKAREILKTHAPVPLHADVRKALEEIRIKAEATVRHQNFEA